MVRIGLGARDRGKGNAGSGVLARGDEAECDGWFDWRLVCFFSYFFLVTLKSLSNHMSIF